MKEGITMTEIENKVTEASRTAEIENYQATIDELLEQVEALSARCNFAESRLQKYDGIEETLHQLESDYKALQEIAEKLDQELTYANNRADNLSNIIDDKQKQLALANDRANAWKRVVMIESFEKHGYRYNTNIFD